MPIHQEHALAGILEEQNRQFALSNVGMRADHPYRSTFAVTAGDLSSGQNPGPGTIRANNPMLIHKCFALPIEMGHQGFTQTGNVFGVNLSLFRLNLRRLIQ